jgi:hypothetical protein
MTPRPTLEPQPKLYFTSNVTKAAKRYARDIFCTIWTGWRKPKAARPLCDEYYWQLVGRQIVACEIKAMRPRQGPLGLAENIAIGILYALDEWDDDGGPDYGSDKSRARKALLKLVTIDGQRVKS